MIFEGSPGWQSARAARSVGPGADPEGLRRGYLELLKLCLCDLAGTTTMSVGKSPDGRVSSRQITGEELRLRSAGMDWPLQGLTMVGLTRLDDLQSCVETVVADGVAGDVIEAGAWRGGASMLMRATLDSLGEQDRTVWVADSFQGFPREDEQEGLNDVGFLSIPLEEVKGNFSRFGIDRGVRFLPGFFQDTLADLSDERWALVRLDGDTYETTWLSLQSLYPGLSAGGYLVVDDYGALEECREAVEDFRAMHGITEPLEQIDWTGMRWRRETANPIEAADPPRARPPRAPRGAGRGVDRDRDPRVPTEEELDLRRRLEAAEAEIGRLRGSPVAGPRSWLAARLRGGPS